MTTGIGSPENVTTEIMAFGMPAGPVNVTVSCAVMFAPTRMVGASNVSVPVVILLISDWISICVLAATLTLPMTSIAEGASLADSSLDSPLERSPSTFVQSVTFAGGMVVEDMMTTSGSRRRDPASPEADDVSTVPPK